MDPIGFQGSLNWAVSVQGRKTLSFPFCFLGGSLGKPRVSSYPMMYLEDGQPLRISK